MDNSALLEKYEIVVGLEVHAQLLTNSKAYCADSTIYGAPPNSQISPVSLGHPGTLPYFNEQVLAFGVKLGLALHCEITEVNRFARKNYFYADLPKGYQITQDKTPLCTGGHVDIKLDGDEVKRIGITRIHMEEDAGKSMHDQDPYDSLIDLNRCGIPLLEIVSEPDMRSGEEAYSYLLSIRRMLRYLEICDGNMEEGSMRCDANISVRAKGSEELGNRVEVKNLNSFRNVQRAIEHEALKQMRALENREVVARNTVNYNAVTNTTKALRSKEHANDYRYFPEPDLPPLIVKQNYIDEIKEEMPPLPEELHKKFTVDYGLSEYDAGNITEEKQMALYFEELCTYTDNYKAAANWLMGPVKSFLNQNALELSAFKLKPLQIAEIIKLIDDKVISNAAAIQTLFPALLNDPANDAAKLVADLNLNQESDSDVLTALAQEILAEFPDKVEDYKSGKKGLLGLFMGQLMKRSKGKANPKEASAILEQLLNQGT